MNAAAGRPRGSILGGARPRRNSALPMCRLSSIRAAAPRDCTATRESHAMSGGSRRRARGTDVRGSACSRSEMTLEGKRYAKHAAAGVGSVAALPTIAPGRARYARAAVLAGGIRGLPAGKGEREGCNDARRGAGDALAVKLGWYFPEPRSKRSARAVALRCRRCKNVRAVLGINARVRGLAKDELRQPPLQRALKKATPARRSSRIYWRGDGIRKCVGRQRCRRVANIAGRAARMYSRVGGLERDPVERSPQPLAAIRRCTAQNNLKLSSTAGRATERDRESRLWYASRARRALRPTSKLEG